ncbi:hypothetical protein BC835DRAFT_1416327 [Cytidiella melzeri]|nr:hypothetical protein BC835DRAFT_1416327 [Cytidiella melzeri]
MDTHVLSIVVIVLELIGAVLLCALLATPAPKHAIVKAFVVTTLARSIATVIPSIAFQVIPDNFDALQDHPMIQAFCAADAIILRYLTVTMAAFGISFTLPLLYLSCKFSKNPEYSEYSHCQPFYRFTTGALAFGPFVWALPTIFTPLPLLSRRIASVKPQFMLAVCTISDTVSDLAALVLLVSALGSAVIFAMVFMFHLWNTIRLPLVTHSLGRLDITRLVRFAALLGIFVISITLYSILTASWVEGREHKQPAVSRLPTLFKISIIWECVTPILYFLIFAAHEEVFSVWRTWSHGSHRPRSRDYSPKAKQTRLETSSDSSNGRKRRWFLKASWSLGEPKTLRLDDMPSLARPDTHMADRPASATIIPRHILLRPMLQQQISSVPSVRERVSLDPLGLSPPPRHLGSQCTSPTETIVRQTLVTMPSLTAFGGRSSYSELSMSSEMRRDGQPNSSGELSSRPSTADTFENVGIDDGSWISYPAYPC